MASSSLPAQALLLYGNQALPLDRRAAQVTDAVLADEARDFTYHRFDAAELLRPMAAEAAVAGIEAFHEACEALPLLGSRYLVRLDHVERVRLPAKAAQNLWRRLGELRVHPLQFEGARAWALEEHLLPGEGGGEPAPLRDWVAEVASRPGGGVSLGLAEGAEEATFVVSTGDARHALGVRGFLRTVVKGRFTFADEEDEGEGPPAATSSAAARLHQLLERLVTRPPPECWLLLTARATRESDLSRPLVEALRRHGAIERFVTYDDHRPVDWVLGEARAHGLALDRPGAEQLIRLAGNDQGRLAREVEKLSLLVPRGARPDAATLRQAVHAEQGGTVFQVNDRLGARDLEGALEVLEHFVAEHGGEWPLLTGVLARHFRQLYTVHSLTRLGVSDRDLGSRLKVHPFIARRLAGQAGRFTPGELERIVQALAVLDRETRLHAHLAPVLFRDFVQAVCRGAYREGPARPGTRLSG